MCKQISDFYIVHKATSPKKKSTFPDQHADWLRAQDGKENGKSPTILHFVKHNIRLQTAGETAQGPIQYSHNTNKISFSSNDLVATCNNE